MLLCELGTCESAVCVRIEYESNLEASQVPNVSPALFSIIFVNLISGQLALSDICPSILLSFPAPGKKLSQIFSYW